MILPFIAELTVYLVFLKIFIQGSFVESALNPNSVHFETCFSILKQFAMEIYFDCLQPCLLT